MKKIRKFLLLPASERSLLLKTVVLLWVVRLGLWLLPFQAFRVLLAKFADQPVKQRNQSSIASRQVVRSINVASGLVPRATCLTQATTAKILLDSLGHPAILRIGVARTERGEFQAHAWIEHEGEVIIGGADVFPFTPLLTLDGKVS